MHINGPGGVTYHFTPEGVQFMYDRAAMRRSIAMFEKDDEEAAYAFAEMCLIIGFAHTYKYPLVLGKPKDHPDDLPPPPPLTDPP